MRSAGANLSQRRRRTATTSNDQAHAPFTTRLSQTATCAGRWPTTWESTIYVARRIRLSAIIATSFCRRRRLRAYGKFLRGVICVCCQPAPPIQCRSTKYNTWESGVHLSLNKSVRQSIIDQSSHGLSFGQFLWFDAALVNKLVPCAWLLSGALEVWRLRLRVITALSIWSSSFLM